MKGLALLHATPAVLKESQTWGQKLAQVVAEGSKESLKALAVELIKNAGGFWLSGPSAE